MWQVLVSLLICVLVVQVVDINAAVKHEMFDLGHTYFMHNPNFSGIRVMQWYQVPQITRLKGNDLYCFLFVCFFLINTFCILFYWKHRCLTTGWKSIGRTLHVGLHVRASVTSLILVFYISFMIFLKIRHNETKGEWNSLIATIHLVHTSLPLLDSELTSEDSNSGGCVFLCHYIKSNFFCDGTRCCQSSYYMCLGPTVQMGMSCTAQ